MKMKRLMITGAILSASSFAHAGGHSGNGGGSCGGNGGPSYGGCNGSEPAPIVAKSGEGVAKTLKELADFLQSIPASREIDHRNGVKYELSGSKDTGEYCGLVVWFTPRQYLRPDTGLAEKTTDVSIWFD